MNDFNSNNFAVQVIASGSFADQPVYADKTYLVETVTIRLNPVALNAWLDTVAYDDRDCFENTEEWSDYIGRKADSRIEFKKHLAQIVGFACKDAGREVSVKQIVSEVFAVAWIHEIMN